ncbi:MAG: tRNA dihydrouridine(20/20a) synthase DusA [Rhodospirillaceae bacterium]|nr:tRNA dihydrouridine(20/20a) synthase DusA [Rhodospirillaceae bacterium]
MMDCTDRHCRYLLRLVTRRTRLYSEMVTSAAIVRSPDPGRFLEFGPAEKPLAMQLGGSEPVQLAEAARRAESWGYDEINLNVGCPSERVTSGRFGACLMAEPALVAECVGAMRAAVRVPVTVKTRIGIDDLDSDEHLDEFISTVAAAGCNTFIIHARKAWLHGLSPKENREIPPLRYDRVYKLKRSFPHLEVVLNGGLKSLDAASAALTAADGTALDGVMLGRAPYDAPYMLAEVDRLFFGDTAAAPGRAAIATDYIAYARDVIAGGLRPHHVLRHMVGLFHGCAGARGWRQAVARVGQSGTDLHELKALAQRIDEQVALAA